MSKADRLREMQVRINDLESEIILLKEELVRCKKQPTTILDLIRRDKKG